MLQKLFFSLLGILASLVGFWGVVRMGWTWELVGSGAATMVFFGLALATGNRAVSRPKRRERRGGTPADPTRSGITQRYEWGELTGRRSA